MANDESEQSESSDAPSGGILKDWVLPVVAGVGLGIVGLFILDAAGVSVRAPSFFKSDAEQLVSRWDWEDMDLQDELFDEIVALGPEARDDLRRAYESVDGEAFPEQKAWVADLLLAEPFFDSRYLQDQATSGTGWNRRIAAVALVKNLRDKVNPDVVFPGLEDWLEDTEHEDHGLALGALGELLSGQALTSAQRDRTRELLLALADPEQRPTPADSESWIYVDRAGAAHLLGEWIPDEEVEALLRSIALDDSDDFEPRISSLRALAEASRFDDVSFWDRAADATDQAVRQTVADNLYRAKSDEFDPVLAKLHSDAWELTRSGSVDTQVKRRRPTPLEMFPALIEDVSQWVRFHTLLAAARMKDHPGHQERLGIALHLLTEGIDTDVEGAILLLFAHTGEHFGFDRLEVQETMDAVDEGALAAFMLDPEERARVRTEFEAILPDAVPYDATARRRVLEKLLDHADEATRNRAKAELAALGTE